MHLPILNILRSQNFILDYQQILRVLLLRCFGEIEASSDNGFPLRKEKLSEF